MPSMLFFHKPLLETYYAYWNAQEHNETIDGEKREGVAYLYNDAKIFNLALEILNYCGKIYSELILHGGT